HDVVGDSPAMRDVFRRAIKANRFHDLPVLIEGEKGTPKRRLAAAILYLDPQRVRMPFFALGCAGLGRVLGILPGLGAPDARAVAGPGPNPPAAAAWPARRYRRAGTTCAADPATRRRFWPRCAGRAATTSLGRQHHATGRHVASGAGSQGRRHDAAAGRLAA